MNKRKSERLLNLLIMLLVTRHWIPKARIREALYADAAGDEAFEKMFERDKEELRSIGVPIEVGEMDAYFGDEQGYRVRPDEFALPEVSLTAEEASIVALAGRAWGDAGRAEDTTRAVAKLRAAGLEVDRSALDIVEPRLHAEEPSFEAFWSAFGERLPVRFGYRRAPGEEPQVRRLEPWGVVRSSGRWYVAGRDRDRDERRVFRLSRVVGEVIADGRPGDVVIPPGTEVGRLAESLAPPSPGVPATVLVRSGCGHALRRLSANRSNHGGGSSDPGTDPARSEQGVMGPDGTTGWDRLVLPDSGPGVADEVLAHGADVVVEAPAELRGLVVERLRAALATAAESGAGS